MSTGSQCDLGFQNGSITVPQILSNIQGLGVPAKICSPCSGAEVERERLKGLPTLQLNDQRAAMVSFRYPSK